MNRLVYTLLALAALGLAVSSAWAQAEAARPALLFCCPGENRYEYAGYDYMRALTEAGFAVDYLEGSAELTWDRVKNYNVLFIYDFPPPGPESDPSYSLFALQPPWLDDYFTVLDRFLKAGGGLFLHYCPSYGAAAPNHLLKSWGLQFPLIWLRHPATQMMTNIPVPVAYTDRVLPSPVSEGVRGFWYPTQQHYCGQDTMPILVDENWQVVARPAATAYTEVPTYPRGGSQPPPTALIPSEPIKDPVLFAIRNFPGGGRLAAVQTWYQYSVGSGMKWLYNNEVLSKGLAGRPSDYGRLLENTYRWLAEPSLRSGAVGGFVTDPARLLEPQLRPGAQEKFHDWYYSEEEILEYRRPPSSGKIFRGLIGAQTALSGGAGSVADYAQAATEAGLDFVIFLEDLAGLTPEKLATLREEVQKNSTDTLQLIAGYRAKCNTGNYLFVCGLNPLWPDERMLVGPDRRTLNLQYQDEEGKWVFGNVGLDWCLQQAGSNLRNNIGYYNFTKSGQGLRMNDLRVFSMAAIRTYEDGRLVEDVTDEYLITCQSTSVPTPVSVNLVRSPAELKQAVAQNQALTYAQARSLATVFTDALRWQGSYDGMNVFPSDGPIIEAWPRCHRVMTFGAEQFVSGRSMIPSPIHVTSQVGLKEIRIYDGRELFRRFLCNGAKEFETTLFFPGTVQRGLVLIAEDLQGGVATSFAYRQYKEGTLCPIFCGDHVNDCGYMLLSRGPHWPMFFRTPNVPQAGGTWDGGPLPARPLLSPQFTYPCVDTDKGVFDGTPYQMPLLEFSDEGATRCRMVSDRVLVEGVPNINPWYTFGPLEPSPLVDMWGSHTLYDQYITGVEPNAYGAIGVFEGPIASLFTEQFTFKQDMTLNALRVFHAGWRDKLAPRSTLLAIGRGAEVRDVWDLTETPEQPREARLATGDWFALYSGQVANTHLFINRGSPVVLQAHPATSYWLQIWADGGKRPVKKGDTWEAEFFAMTWPLNDRPLTAREIAEMVVYLEKPTGLRLTRGKQVPGPGGLLELTPDNYAVELTIPKPEGVTRTVPVRVSGLNRRWSAGLYQIEGWRTHYYSPENSGWRALGLDFEGRAYVPLYVSKMPNTHVMIGHPVVADAAGKDLFIQVTRLNDGLDGRPPAWHLSVNNPTDRPLTSTLRKVMDLPGLRFVEEKITIGPGEYRVLSRRQD